MKLKSLLFALAALFVAFSANGQIEEPVSWTQKSVDKGDGNYELRMTATIEHPFHMYDMGPYVDGPNATTVTFTPVDGVDTVGTVTASAEPKKMFDEGFGMEIGYYEGSVTFVQNVKVTSAEPVTVKMNIEWQTCNDVTCLPPADEDFIFKLDGVKGGTVAAASDGASADVSAAETTVAPAQEGNGEVSQLKRESSIWSTIIAAILWGFAALLTPCVFPMVPMTVSFFMKNSGSKSKGRFMAAFYGFSIIALYTLPIAIIILITYIAGGDAVTADIFNWLSTHWLPNIVFFLVFMIFAASFLGAFEIVLPSSLVNKSDAKADKGGLVGVFFMALTLVLVSFSCTGPIVGTILVQSTQGAVWEPILTMFVFSAAFALPFTIFAFFPSLLKNLPKSGGWLNSVKVVLGFIELALGLKFLSVADQTYHWGLLDREVYIALWIVIFSMLGFYLLGKLRFAHDSEEPYVKVKKLILAIITFAFVVYLIPGMFGAPLKALSGYLPPMHTHDFNLLEAAGSQSVSSADVEARGKKYSDFLHMAHGLNGFFDYEEGMEYARKVGKPVLVDFTGHGCVNCREMEANVWSDKEVLRILNQDYVIISLYVDDKKELPESDWVTLPNGKVLKTLGKINAQFQAERFGVNGQPYYVILDNEGKELVEPRGYNLSVPGYIDFLNSGVAKYKEKD